jgi:putative transposase
MMKERGVSVDHSTLNRWVLRYTPDIEQKIRKYKSPVGTSWRMDETYIEGEGTMEVPL